MLSSKVRSIASNSCMRAVMVTEFMYLTAGGVDGEEQLLGTCVKVQVRSRLTAYSVDDAEEPPTITHYYTVTRIRGQKGRDEHRRRANVVGRRTVCLLSRV